MLASWKQCHRDESCDDKVGQQFDEVSPTVVSGVSSTRQGFLAACASGEQSILIGSIDSRVGEDPNLLLDCAEQARGTEAIPDVDEIQNALERATIYLRGKASLSGIRSSSATGSDAKQSVLARIAQIERASRPHTRARIAVLADEARRGLDAEMGAAAEADLRALATLDITDEDWLVQVGQLRRSSSLPAGRADSASIDASPDRIVALIIFGSTPTRAVKDSLTQ
jgi:hypothetical protein